jgi:methionyl-tRNA formyltransferase
VRLVFLGTPEAAVAPLTALVDAGHHVELVITRPDRRRGRGGELSPSPVKVAALSRGLRVGHRLAELDDLDVDRGVVVAYGVIIPGALLERIPMLNVHFSLLPRWRGAAPVERAILAGDAETGVSVMTLEVELDTGPVHLERRVDIGEKTSAALLDELSHVGAAALVEVLASPDLLEHPTVQVGDVTYAQKLDKETFHVTPSMDVELFLRTVRLGRAFCFVNERRLLVLRARRSDHTVASATVRADGGDIVLGVANGAVALDEVRAEGSRAMSASSWWAGARLNADAVQWS